MRLGEIEKFAQGYTAFKWQRAIFNPRYPSYRPQALPCYVIAELHERHTVGWGL